MKVLLFANTAWYLYNFRRSLAEGLQSAGYEVVLASPPDEYGPKLLEAGLRWISVPMERRSVNPIRELLLLRWLKHLMQSESIDLVHSFTIKCAIYGSISARMAGVPARVGAIAGMGYVYTRNGVRARALRVVANTMMRIALGGQGVRLILQNGADLAAFEVAGFMDKNGMRLIPSSGVNCRRFSPGNRIPREGGFKVLLASRLLWDKGLAEFAEAAALVNATGRPVVFLLAGAPDAGNPTAVPESTVQQWQATGRLQWLGHISEMASLFRSVDAVVLPSYREGLPKGLIEAGACGLPLITTDVPGCRDVVEHQVDGLLVPVRNAQALADAVVRLYDNPDLCTALGAAARVKVLKNFDERKVIADTIAVYAEVMPA